MRKLLSTTALAAMLAIAGGAWAQQAGSGQPGATAQPGATGTAQTGQRGDAGSVGSSGAAGAAPTGQAGERRGRVGTAGQPSVGGQTAGMMSEEDVRAKLATEGFGNVQSVTRDGNSFRARAVQNGRPVDITIDAYTGTIRSQAAAR